MYSKLQDGSFIIVGTLPSDAEYKQVGQNSSSLTKFGVKVGEQPSTNADQKPTAIWSNCECWHSVAKVAMDLKKGDVVLCVGKIKENEHGGKVYKNLVCEFVLKMSTESPLAQNNSSSDLSSYNALSNDDNPFDI